MSMTYDEAIDRVRRAYAMLTTLSEQLAATQVEGLNETQLAELDIYGRELNDAVDFYFSIPVSVYDDPAVQYVPREVEMQIEELEFRVRALGGPPAPAGATISALAPILAGAAAVGLGYFLWRMV